MEQYFTFLSNFFEEVPKLVNNKVKLSGAALEILKNSIKKVRNFKIEQKIAILDITIHLLGKMSTLSDWLEQFFDDLIFSIPIKDLELIIKKVGTLSYEISTRNKHYFIIINALKDGKIPSDSEVLEILELGNPKKVNLLLQFLPSTGRTSHLHRQIESVP